MADNESAEERRARQIANLELARAAKRRKESEGVAEGPVHTAASRDPSEVMRETQDRIKQQREQEFIHGDHVDAGEIAARVKEIAEQKVPSREEVAALDFEPVRGEERPEVAAHRAAMRQLELEARMRFEMSKARSDGRSTREVAAQFKISPRRRAADPTDVIPDEAIHRTKDGRKFMTRFVRTSDNQGKPDRELSRLQSFRERYDAEVIVVDGAPLIRRWGVAIQMHPDEYAQRIVDNSPPGAATLRATNEEFVELAKAAKSPVIGYGGREDVSQVNR